jgi:hypothetical protein
MPASDRQIKPKLTFQDRLTIFWKYINQPIFDPDFETIFNLRSFKQHCLQVQLLERCWQIKYTEVLERCWHLEFQSQPTQSYA